MNQKPKMKKPLPASSPRSADKFPSPLMRFLRSNAGSRSTRGRPPRSSPLFYLRSSKRPVTDINQEPSSPKVTCIGQVRVRRRRRDGKRKGRHRWIRLRRMKITLIFRRVFRVLRFECGNCWRADKDTDCSGKKKRGESCDVQSGNSSNPWRRDDEVVNNNQIEATKREFDESVPPKNALILTRCRSAPNGCSSLGSKLLWDSLTPLPDQEQGKPEIRSRSEEFANPKCNAIIDREINKEMKKNSEEIEEEEEEEEEESGGKRLPLRRSKSLPARRGERLNPEGVFLTLDIEHSSLNGSF